jgi:hypothetical protein
MAVKTYGCLEQNYTIWLEITRRDFVAGEWVTKAGLKVHFGVNRTCQGIEDESVQKKIEATSQFKNGFIFDLEEGPKLPTLVPSVVTGKRHVGRLLGS